jgi:plastocyanin
MEFRKLFAVGVLGAALVACGGAKDEADEAAADVDTAAAVATTPAPEQGATPAAGGSVIEVKMIDENGVGRFDPAEVTAKAGDVIRYTLVSGVHNVNFAADKNPGKSGLPAASAFITTPGQTYDVAVNMPAGEYNFQCDPHVAMGMVGKLTVQ